MRKSSLLLTLVTIAALAAVAPALSQDEGGGADAATPGVSATPSAASGAPASSEDAERPVCPLGRTTTLNGAPCAPRSVASDVSQPDFAALGVLSGAQHREIIAGSDAR